MNQNSAYDDDRNPLVKQGKADVDNNKLDDAIADYESALGANPKLAGVHLALAQLYAEKINDPVGAIFHYRRFLQLQPNADGAADIKDQIDKEMNLIATKAPDAATPEDLAKVQALNGVLNTDLADTKAKLVASDQQVKDLQQEVADLKSAAATMASSAPTPGPRSPVVVPGMSPPPLPPVDPGVIVQNTSTTAVGTSAVNPANPNAPVTPTTASTDTGGTRTYKVVSGDSIWKISKKFYPGHITDGEEKIKEANKDTEGKPLRVGQILNIPE